MSRVSSGRTGCSLLGCVPLSFSVPLTEMPLPFYSQASAGQSSCAGLSSRRRLTGLVSKDGSSRSLGRGLLCALGILYPRGGAVETWEQGYGLEGCMVLVTFLDSLFSFQKLHDLVLPLVMSVQQGEVLGSSPYNSSCCRRELYRLLLALLLSPSPRCPPPLACALKAFSLGQWEDSLEVTANWARAFFGSWVLLFWCLPCESLCS